MRLTVCQYSDFIHEENPTKKNNLFQNEEEIFGKVGQCNCDYVERRPVAEESPVERVVMTSHRRK